MKAARENKWLIVQASVVLTPIIDPVIASLDPYFEKANLKAIVTSGLRDAEDQLRVIRSYLVKKGLNKKFEKAMTCAANEANGSGIYVWQEAWSALLNVGVIINPPFDAKCLAHTTFDKRDRFGVLIHQTPHARGTAFNIGGGGNGVDDEAAVLQQALNDKLPGMVNFLKERENNACHINCERV